MKRKTWLPEIVDYVKDAVIYINECLFNVYPSLTDTTKALIKLILQPAVRLVFISTGGDAAHSFTVYKQYKISFTAS